MPARVCSNCTIKYPHLITECRVCGNVLKYESFQVPDYDWEERAAAGSEDARTIPMLKCASVRDQDGRRWLYSQDLRGSGWLGEVSTFDLFETADGIIEVQGFDGVRKRWWVEVLS